MRTTVDLPDDVFREAKSKAALMGMKFKDYAEALFRQGIVATPETPTRRGRTDPIPVRIPAGRLTLPHGTTNADLFEAIDREDDDRLREITRRQDD